MPDPRGSACCRWPEAGSVTNSPGVGACCPRRPACASRYRRLLTDFQETEMQSGRLGALASTLAVVGLLAASAPALAGPAPAHTTRSHAHARIHGGAGKRVRYYLAVGDS